MTMTVAEPTVAVGVPMMTADEAEACLAKIGESAVTLRDQLLDLDEREGWRALGYQSWRACILARFGETSERHLYRLLEAARVDRDICPMGQTGAPLPERQARELAKLPTPEARREAYAEATAAGPKGKATVDTVQKAVKQRQPKPSVRSEAPAADISQEPPTDDGRADAPDDSSAFGFNNERSDLPHPAGSICGNCNERFTGDRCPCADTVTSGADEDDYPQISDVPCTACGGEIEVTSAGMDRQLASHHLNGGASYCSPFCAGGQKTSSDAERGAPAAPGAAVSSAVEDGAEPSSTTPASEGGSPAPSEASPSAVESEQPTGRTIGIASTANWKPKIPEVVTTSSSPRRTPDGDPIIPVPQEIGAFTRAYADLFTSGAIAEAIVSEVATNQAVSIAQGLVDRLPVEQLGAVVHRAQVRLRNAGQGEHTAPAEPRTYAEIDAAIRLELPEASKRLAVMGRLRDGIDDVAMLRAMAESCARRADFLALKAGAR